jgi:hypothetical protein
MANVETCFCHLFLDSKRQKRPNYLRYVKSQDKALPIYVLPGGDFRRSLPDLLSLSLLRSNPL